MEKLGIDPLLISVQILNFGLLLFLLKKILYKPILKVIKERAEKIAAIDKDRLALATDRDNFEKAKDEALKETQKKKKELLEEATILAASEKKKILEKANGEAKEIVKKAVNEAERMSRDSQKESDAKVLEVAFELSKKALEGRPHGTSEISLARLNQIRKSLNES